MKKLFMGFVTAALLTVCLCVPAFAFEYPCACRDKSYFRYFYDENSHYVFCPGHMTYVPLTDDDGTVMSHTEPNCHVCAEYDAVPFCYTWTKGLEGALLSGRVGGYYDSIDHYVFCYDCGFTIKSSSIFGNPVVHTGDSCQACAQFKSYGLTVYDTPPGTDSSDSEGIAVSITTLVTASINWLTAFALCIISTPLFLIFVCCIFVGLGIALIKRSIHL